MQTHPTPETVTGPADRRHFLRLGAGVAVGAAALAACGGQAGPPPAETGDKPLKAETTLAPPPTTSPEQGQTVDASMVRTARSLALGAVQIYSILLGESVDLTGDGPVSLASTVALEPDVTDLFTLLRSRYEAHAVAMVPLILKAKGEPVTEANAGFVQNLLVDNLATLTSQQRIVGQAHAAEAMITATFSWAAGQVSTVELRTGLMATGAAIARQSSATVLPIDPRGISAAPTATIDTSGPARVPEYMLLTDGQDGGDVPLSQAAADAADQEASKEDVEKSGG